MIACILSYIMMNSNRVYVESMTRSDLECKQIFAFSLEQRGTVTALAFQKLKEKFLKLYYLLNYWTWWVIVGNMIDTDITMKSHFVLAGNCFGQCVYQIMLYYVTSE